VARLKQQPGKDLVVLGSGALIQSLVPHGLIDEYLLLIHRWCWDRDNICSPQARPPLSGSPAA